MSQVLFGGVPLAVNGITPHIGGNGHWYYGNVDSKKSAMGTDGAPIGTIISVMGYNPPSGYLVCDGSTYRIEDYEDLANYFAEQFKNKGGVNRFGGNGTKTFAVPDMRNMFIRGYHCNGGNQYSGNIGETQEATSVPYFALNSNKGLWFRYPSSSDSPLEIINEDYTSSSISVGASYVSTTANGSTKKSLLLNVRPINITALFCIKYTNGQPSLPTYALDEEVLVGYWIDRKPIYRRVIHTGAINLSSGTNRTLATINVPIDTVVNLQGIGNYNENPSTSTVLTDIFTRLSVNKYSDRTEIFINAHYSLNYKSVEIIIEYTKA